MEFLPVIKQSTDAVINVSTGGGLGMTMDERLRAATTASPEMASLNMGECYDLGHLYNVKWFVDKGLIKPPFFIQMVFGILGGAGADLDNLMHMHNIADKLFGAENYEWSVLAAGRHQMPFATQSAMLGGNLRVGLEDSLYIGPKQLAKSNAEQVLKIRSIIENLGLQVATPDEARSRLDLKGNDLVKF